MGLTKPIAHIAFQSIVLIFTAGCADQEFKSAASNKKKEPTKASTANSSQNPGDNQNSDMVQSEQGSIDCKKIGKGKVIVSNDEWAFSEAGLKATPDAKQYAKNVAAWLGGCEGRSYGKFHAYSTNFSLTEPTLAKEFSDLGHTWSSGININLNPEAFSKFDWIFLAGPVPDASKLSQILSDFVEKGGGLYISAGTFGNASLEASWWNPLTAKFGIQLASSYNKIKGNIPISDSAHPIFKGVKELYQDNGNSLSLIAPLSKKSKLLISSGLNGLYAIYDGSISD